MSIMKNVPIGAWVFASVAVVAVLGSFVAMGIAGGDTAELRWVVLTILNAGAGLASVGGIVYSGAAARSAQTAVEQTNGKSDRELQEIADRAAVQVIQAYRSGVLAGRPGEADTLWFGPPEHPGRAGLPLAERNARAEDR